jgi:hypothetical protein
MSCIRNPRIVEPLLLAAPERGVEAEGQRSGAGVAVVVEQVVEQQRHRLHVGAVHDVVADDRVVLLVVGLAQVLLNAAPPRLVSFQ